MARTKSNIPVSNSTPKNIQIVTRRPGIHDHDEESPVHNLSPIPKTNIEQCKEKLYLTDEHDGLGKCSDSEEEYTSEDDISQTSSSHRTFEKSHSVSTKLNYSKPPTEIRSTNGLGNILCKNNAAILTILLGIVGATVFCLSSNSTILGEVVSNTRLTIKDLQEKYPSQSNEVWDDLRFSVMDSKELNKPVTFLLLYNKSSENTTFQLVKDMASYSVCVLNRDCSYEAITLNGHTLDPALQSNYILDKYMAELQNKFVMIMLNVDALSGLHAQNFHFLCDVYSPTAFQSVYFFTINVDGEDNSSKSDEMVEIILRRSWMDLDDDKFYPLLTRLTNIYIKVVPEDHL